MSLDGFVAGPNPTLEEPLGEGGERLHDWVVKLESWKRRHGQEGGETNPDSDGLEEAAAAPGATVRGRNMFSGGFGPGPWDEDPTPDGWWGEDPPFHVPVFVVTHHPRETLEKQGGTSFAFVTDGFESAVERAQAAAGDRNVSLAGGASVVRQALAAGVLDELQLHVAPVLLGGGTSLFAGARPARLEVIRVLEAAHATHIRYRVGG